MVYVERIRKAISTAKTLVAYFKKTGLNNELDKSLKQSNDTRWNSTLDMIVSLLQNQNGLQVILQERHQENRLAEIDWPVLSMLCNFLQPFAKATKALEGENKPTIHWVYQYYWQLKKSVECSPTDSPILRFLKVRATICIQEKFFMCDIHYLALFVNPRYKGLVPLSETKRKEIHSLARGFIEALFPKPTATELCGDHNYVASQKKTKLTIDDDFILWQNDAASSSVNCRDEVGTYVTESFYMGGCSFRKKMEKTSISLAFGMM